MLISKEITCVTDASKRGFIHHASLTISASSLTILAMVYCKKASFAIEAGFIGHCNRLRWSLQ